MTSWVAAGMAALSFAASALADDVTDRSGRWVFNQLDGRGGAGCLMQQTMQDGPKGSLRLTLENPDSCFDVTNGLATWFTAGDVITLADAKGTAKLDLTCTRDGESLSCKDASDTWFMERLDDLGQ